MNKQELICDCDVIHKEVVEKVKEVMPEKQTITNLTSLYKAFADKTRLEILYALHESEMCVCDLAVLLNMTKSAISHQLKTLRLANLVKNRREGKIVYYSLTDKRVYEIFEQSFKHVAE
ncbi:ArsR family transcriptional regulator [Listeria monocytogenes]|uniref:Cd(II)-sensing metalloregulatory transcriptional repressor CadC n=1 Tax=Listeria monocytogenes TaxID=1639 RepID=UPI000E721E2C|nr:Cd(II)-sensing metalloregulatory transcriptional repressor CadC [Listeria monocytogenes]EAD9566609.1 ArsR family transcriptional regulator [Listeria monocytogenes]EAE1488682.1 ArsR family transcriptional regulator [Listeria monocytogenes]EAE1540018.1 ArsR family transcriptional regulator [Listeria monocytogenes]MOA74434.1 ArsR family transcriptional regulator [Listeria monocytogenes]RJZ93626.1 Transcriptional repressor SmtB [Listeria monocytogenes]